MAGLFVTARRFQQRQHISALNQQVTALTERQEQEKADLNNILRQRIQQLESLNAVIATTSGVLAMPALMRSTLDQMLQIMGLLRGVMWVHEYSASRGVSDEALHALKEIAHQHPQQLSRKVLVSDWQDAPAHLSELAPLMQQLNIRASFTHPIFCSSRISGYMTLVDSSPRAWVQEETAILEIIAHQIGFTAERAQLVQDIQHQNQLMRTLVTQSDMLNRTFMPEDVIEAIGKGALDLTQADTLAVLEIQPDQSVECSWSNHASSPLISALLNAPQLSGILTPNPLFVKRASEEEGLRAIVEQANQAEFASFFVWPLVYEGQADVFVCGFYQKETDLKQNEREVMETFFRQAAAALQNTRLFVAESSQRQLAEALREITVTLASTLNLDEVLEGILDQLSRVIPHDASDIMLLEDDSVRILRFRGFPRELHDEIRKFHFPISNVSNLLLMKETGQAIVVPNIEADPSWVSFPFSRWLKSYAGAPMVHRGVVFGFINVSSRQRNFYHPETGEILQVFASQAAIFIENARLYQTTERRVAETDALFRAMLPLFNTNEDIAALCRQITESVTCEFSSAHASLLLVDETRNHLVMTAQSGYAQPGVPVLPLEGSGLTVAAYKKRQIIYAPNVKEDNNYVAGAPETRSELVIPLIAGEHALGVLNLESHEVNAFDERAQALLSSYAERAALGLENARLFEAIRRNADQMLRLNAITRTALQTANSKEILNALAGQVAQMINADCCLITRWDAASRAVAVQAAYGAPGQSIPLLTQASESTLTETALRLDQTLVIEDIFNTPYLNLPLSANPPFTSALVLPLISEEYQMGALMIGFHHSHLFSRDEITLSEQAAGQIALALTRLLSLELAQRRANEAEKLRQASLALTSSLELQEVLNSILSSLEQVLPFDSACVFLMQEDHWRVGAVRNLPVTKEIFETQFTQEDELSLEIRRTLRPVILADAQSDPRFKRWGSTNYVRGWMGVPLISGGLVLGILTLDRREANSFSQEEVELAQGFASHAAAAIQNAQLHSAMQRLAITDPLTGAYNRRGFFELAQKMIASLQRAKRPLSALMIDIDYFKRINDQYGHDIGDVALRAMTARCKKILRETDLICRYGGEEFAILLPESDLAGAQIVASRIFANVTQQPIESAAGPVSMTISVGVATITDEPYNLEVLLKCADIALYNAKQEGRNRICTWNAQQTMQP